MPTKLSWNPRRIGNRYCSPACGRGCTWAEYQQAYRKATALAHRLGHGWHIRVWENLGWHYLVHNGLLSVKPSLGKQQAYYAWLADDNSLIGCGSSYWTDTSVSVFSNPRDAVSFTMKLARKFVQKVDTIVTATELNIARSNINKSEVKK